MLVVSVRLLVLPAPGAEAADDAGGWEEPGALLALPPPETTIVKRRMNAEHQLSTAPFGARGDE
jgi:hypothetical protein